MIIKIVLLVIYLISLNVSANSNVSCADIVGQRSSDTLKSSQSNKDESFVLDAVSEKIPINKLAYESIGEILRDLDYSKHNYDLTPMKVGVEIEAAISADIGRKGVANKIVSFLSGESGAKDYQILESEEIPGLFKMLIKESNTGLVYGVHSDFSLRLVSEEFDSAEVTSPIIQSEEQLDSFKGVLSELAKNQLTVSREVVTFAGMHTHIDFTNYENEEILVLLLVYSLYEKEIFQLFMPHKERAEEIYPFANTVLNFIKSGHYSDELIMEGRFINDRLYHESGTAIKISSLIGGLNIEGGTVEFRHGNTTLEAQEIDKMVYFFAHLVKSVRSKDDKFFKIVNEQHSDWSFNLAPIMKYFKSLGSPFNP